MSDAVTNMMKEDSSYLKALEYKKMFNDKRINVEILSEYGSPFVVRYKDGVFYTPELKLYPKDKELIEYVLNYFK
jgi:hypothetical protein